MSAILKDEESVAVEQAVTAGTGPSEMATTSGDLSALPKESKSLASRKITAPKL